MGCEGSIDLVQCSVILSRLLELFVNFCTEEHTVFVFVENIPMQDGCVTLKRKLLLHIVIFEVKTLKKNFLIGLSQIKGYLFM